MADPAALPSTDVAEDIRLQPRGNMLAPRSRQWPSVTALLLVAAIVTAVAADLVDAGHLAIPGAIGLTATACVVAALGVRTHRRDITTDRAVEAFAPVLGWPRPSREILRVRRWSSGVPTLIDLAYNGAGMTVEPGWFATVTETVRRRGWGHFEVARHDQRNCVLTFAAASKPEKTENQAETRVNRTVKALFGPGASVTDISYDDEGIPEAFDVSHEISHKLAPSGYRARLEKVVTTTFPGRWRARWDLTEDTVRFEQRPVLPSSLWNPERTPASGDDLKANYEQTAIALGVDEDGDEHTWIPALHPHFLFSGSTGSGKTATGHSVLIEFTRHGWPVWVLDAKGIEFLPFQDWPNVQIVGTHLTEQIAIIYRAWQLMEYRYAQIVSGRARVSDFDPLLVFIDEFADFMSNLREWYPQHKVKGDPAKPPVLSYFHSLARKARTARIHMVVSLQRPDAEIFGGGESRDNFRQRFSIGMLSADGAAMMWGSPAIGTSIPSGLRQRGISVGPTGEPKEMQAYRVPDPAKTADPDELELLERLRPTESHHERLLIKPPLPSAATLTANGIKSTDDHDDPDILASIEPSFRDWCEAEWVLAADHPHLDPVAKRHARAAEGRHDPAAGSTLALFGLEQRSGDHSLAGLDNELAAATPPARPALHLVPDPIDEPSDDWPGYGEHLDIPAHQARLGDLVCLDDTTDEWAVIDTEPGEDFANPDDILITWRGLGDTDGTTTFGDGEYIRIRRPQN